MAGPTTTTATALQAGDGVEVVLHTGLVVLALQLLASLLGLYISYQAYRGYRRNSSEPMLYLSAGIVLLTFVPTLVSTVALNVPPLRGLRIVLAMLARLAGLAAILYGIKYA